MILTVPQDDVLYPTLGPQICDFIEERLVFGPGDLRGQPALLDDEKRGLVYRMYEVFPQGHPQAGRRRFKRCAISLRKGSAKTEFAAWIAGCELHHKAPVRCIGWSKRGQPIGGPVTDPYIPLVAYTEEQSEDLAYGALRVILELSTIAGDFDIGLERILRRDGAGKAVALATAPDARDGARTTFQHFDEPLALDTPVPTTSGWKSIADIAPGDFVFGRDGSAVKVVGVSPVHVGRQCYRVTFRGGESVVTDGAHRWRVVDWKNRPAGERDITTIEMASGDQETGYGLRWRLPRCAGFEGAHAQLPIEPYLLGMWLGNGATNAGYIHNSPADYLEVSTGVVNTASRDSRPGVVRWLPNGLRSKLKAAGLLGSKHIPNTYAFASKAQRLALLQGLMDTDGHATAGGSCTFVQKHRHICEQVAFLVRSLGAEASITEAKDRRSKTGLMCKVHFSPSFCPFRLSRKAKLYQWGPRKSTSWPAVERIDPVESVPVRCIAVDSPDHLFLIGRGLHLTHNTHRFTLPRLVRAHQAMQANIPKRKLADAWSLETTTAPEPGTGSVAEATMEYAKSVKSGAVPDSRLFFFHREASLEHDLETDDGIRAAVLEASGPIADWSDLDSIIEQWRDPTSDRTYLERVWLNRLVKSSSQAFDVEQWKTLADPHEVKHGALITLGFDGALFFDSTALVATEVETGYQWVLGLWERPPNRETWKVPEEDVDRAVRAAFKNYNVWRMYADPPHWDSWIAKWSGEFPERVIEWWTNRRRQIAAALQGFSTAINAGYLKHSGDGNYTRHLGNARKDELNQRDEQGNPMYIIRKERPDSPHKIDAAMAGVLSWEARTDAIGAGATAGEKQYQMLIMGAKK